MAPDTTYHYQLVGSNSAGTNAGADLTFTVPLIPPAVTTLAVSGIGATNATLNGTVNPNNATTTAWFQYGLTTAYGNIGGFTGLPATNASLTLTGLEVNSLVGVAGAQWTNSSAPGAYWQAIAASADGTRLAAAAYGEGIYISVDGGWTWTQSDAPTDSWQGITTSADGTRLAALDGSANNIWTSTNSGVNWSVSGAPSEGWQAIAASADGTQLAAAVSGGGIYTSTGIESTLLPGTTYHFQLVGINSAGTTAGADLTFTTTSGQTPTGITLTGAVTLAGGAFQLCFTNLSGLGFTILGTTNLAVPFADWTVLGAAVESPAGSGNYQFTDTRNTNNATEFYRVRSP